MCPQSRAGGAPSPQSSPLSPSRRHLQSPVCKAFRHVKVDTLSQPEALSRILVPGRQRGVCSVSSKREPKGVRG